MSDSRILNKCTAENDVSNGECDGGKHPEEKLALLQARTRRHFLRSLTAGVGTMFLGTLGFSIRRLGKSRGTGQ